MAGLGTQAEIASLQKDSERLTELRQFLKQNHSNRKRITEIDEELKRIEKRLAELDSRLSR
jgi:hypothetical protein